ncbi:MAG: hypothetical protein KF723_22430 [Rhizobiaceae bacterium]|nr:hypothetical protein [Rhizobiaceae bacterium]
MIDRLVRVARAIWPVKTDLELAARTGTSDRACRDLLARRGGMSLEAVARLLQSEEGLEFLMALLGDASPGWRRDLEVHIDISLERFALEEQRRRIAGLEERAGERFASGASPLRRFHLPKRK